MTVRFVHEDFRYPGKSGGRQVCVQELKARDDHDKADEDTEAYPPFTSSVASVAELRGSARLLYLETILRHVKS